MLFINQNILQHIEIDFPTDGQIDFLCEYAVDLLETRQFEKVIQRGLLIIIAMTDNVLSCCLLRLCCSIEWSLVSLGSRMGSFRLLCPVSQRHCSDAVLTIVSVLS